MTNSTMEAMFPLLNTCVKINHMYLPKWLFQRVRLAKTQPPSFLQIKSLNCKWGFQRGRRWNILILRNRVWLFFARILKVWCQVWLFFDRIWKSDVSFYSLALWSVFSKRGLLLSRFMADFASSNFAKWPEKRTRRSKDVHCLHCTRLGAP